MNNSNESFDNKPPQNNNTANTAGAFIIVFGLAILIKNLNGGHFFPNWLFGWEMIMIMIGLVIGVNSKFQKKSSIVLIVIGSIFLFRDIVGSSFNNLIVPAAVILLGVYLIKRNRSQPMPPPTPGDHPGRPQHKEDEYDWDRRIDPNAADNQEQSATGSENANFGGTASSSSFEGSPYERYSSQFENYLKIDSFFSDTKKILLSENFLGGTVTSVFGSTSINFLQADIKQPVVIDTFQLFGSTKLIIPPHWQVSSNVASIFGELDDRRPIIEIKTDQNKKIYITGTSIFGGLTIKNS